MRNFLIVTFLVLLVFATGLLFLYGFEMIANFVPVAVSTSMFVLGLISYILGLFFLQKKYVYHVDKPDEIRLDSPLFADYFYIFGVMAIVLGIMTFQPLMSVFSKAWIIFSILALYAIYKLIAMVNRVKNALHDKIIIHADWIQLDDPFSNKSSKYKREEIKEIKFIKTFYSSRIFGYSSQRFTLSLKMLIQTEDNKEPFEIEVHPENMNLKVDFVIDALNTMSYTVSYISTKNLHATEWTGHNLN
ncbi:MAG: hypothetical protein RL432_1890 [Bacteroidota bacterium]|jgi:hypothetical protein